MKRLWWSAAALTFISGCGPTLSTMRHYVASSPHRSIAVLPFDVAEGQRNYAAQSAELMASKLQRLGFLVADRRQTRGAFNHLPGKNRLFDDPAAASAIGAQLNVQAVLVGVIDKAYDASQTQAGVYGYETVNPPPCCNAIPRTCGLAPVWDPVRQANVDWCSVRHRRVTIAPSVRNHEAGYFARVRVLDVATQRVIWEDKEIDQAVNDSLAHSADRATDNFADKLIDDFMKGNL